MSSTISVIIPIYNTVSWLPRCMESLFAQSHQPDEIILVDDGSTDGSLELCRSYAAADNRVVVVSQKNGGSSSARNRGLAAASRDYIVFIDSDDWLAPAALETLSRLIETEHPDVIRYGYQKMAGNICTETFRLPYADSVYRGQDLARIQMDTISYEHVLDYDTQRILSVWAGAFKRSLLVEKNITFVSEREICNEDYLFVLEAVLGCQSLAVCGDLLYYYDTREGSLSTVYRTDMVRKKHRLYDCYCEAVTKRDAETQARLRNFYIDCIYDCFANACISPDSAVRTIRTIREFLKDGQLAAYLDQNRNRAATRKTKIICFLMRHRMAGVMYIMYRFIKNRKKKGAAV